jgi:hypothetical protein
MSRLDGKLAAAHVPRGFEAVRAIDDDVIGSYILKCLLSVSFFKAIQRLTP